MIKILEETTKYPLQKIGMMAGVCWGAPTDNVEKNIKRAKDCIISGHDRTLEYVDVEMVIDGVSARVIREWYTHISGAPTRLQSSTRYVEWKGDLSSNIIIPPTIAKAMENELFKNAYDNFSDAFVKLIDASKDIPKEDIAMLYPLGMKTKIVDKRNLRNLVSMFELRTCSRAYWEYRKLMKDIYNELYNLSDEWKWICENCFKTKCEKSGYCTETKSCGRKPKV